MYPRVDKLCLWISTLVSFLCVHVCVSHIHADDLLEDCSFDFFFLFCFVLGVYYVYHLCHISLPRNLSRENIHVHSCYS